MLTCTKRDMKDGSSSQPFEGEKFNEIVDKVVDERLNLAEIWKEQLATMASQYFADLTRKNKGELPNNFLEDFSHIAYLDGPEYLPLAKAAAEELKWLDKEHPEQPG